MPRQRPLGPSEAARRLGVSTRTVQRWLREGRLPGVQVGSRLKVDPVAFAVGGMAEAIREDGETFPAGVPVTDIPARTAVATTASSTTPAATPVFPVPEATAPPGPEATAPPGPEATAPPGPEATAPPGPEATAPTMDPVAPEPGPWLPIPPPIHALDALGGAPIRRLLVLGRREAFVHLAPTARTLGIRLVAAVEQAIASWTRVVDEVVPLDEQAARPAAVLAAARVAAVHGVLAAGSALETDAALAALVIGEGLRWVGPPPSVMRLLDDAGAVRSIAASLGIEALPGPEHDAASSDRDDAHRIEIPVLLDDHGGAVHLVEGEPTLRYGGRSMIEEAPSPAVDADLRARLGKAAVRLARAVGFVGAGTVVFSLDGEGRAALLGLDARSQVESRAAELVSGIDLAAERLRVAGGEPLGLTQADVRLRGHAVAARLAAQDPWAGIGPATGSVVRVRWPSGAGIRIEPGVRAGDIIRDCDDPWLGTITALGATRAEALERLGTALASTSVLGVTSDRGLLRSFLALPAVRDGRATAALLEDASDPIVGAEPSIRERAVAAGAALLASSAPSAGFRTNAPRRLRVLCGERVQAVMVDARALDGVSAVVVDGVAIVDVEGCCVEIRLAPPPRLDPTHGPAQGCSRGQAPGERPGPAESQGRVEARLDGVAVGQGATSASSHGRTVRVSPASEPMAKTE